MDKITKTFQSGEVLKAQDLNTVKDKVNELVDNVNTGGGSGGGGSITVDSSLSTTSTNPAQNKVITEELNKKVEKVDGKGLSTNDYTTAEKEKLGGLANYNDTDIKKAIADEKTRATNAENALSTNKVDKQAGKGLSSNDYTSIEKNKLAGLPANAYSKTEIDTTVTQIKEDINNIQTGDSSPYTRGRMKKIHVVVSGLPSDTYSVSHAPLKYNSDNVISFTTDDGNTSSLSVIWAAINKRPISIHSIDIGSSGKTYQYHANQYFAKDIPSDIIYNSYNDFVTYQTIFGTRERFKHGVAIWPYCGNKDGYFMDREQPVNPNAGNLYRFMSPYLNWEDCNLMKHYGTDFYFHNIGTETYGPDKDIFNVIQGLSADLSRTKSMTGRIMKILARPDGNNTFIEAMNEIPKIDMAVAENLPAVDCKPNTDVEYYHKTWSRIFKDDIDSVLKPQLANLINNTASNDKTWFHFCCHTATGAWADFLKFISDTYGNNISDKTKRIWFCTVGELYEYMYFRKYGKFSNVKNNGTTFEFDYEFPFKENFNYKDVTFKIMNSGGTQISIGSIDAYETYTNEKVYGCQTASDSDGALIHLNIEETFIENVEFFVFKYEETGDSIWREDAELELPKLIPSLRSTYQARIDAVSNPVNITGLSLNKSSLNLTNGDSQTLQVTALPVDNSQMNKITYVLRDISNINVSIGYTGNIATATLTNTNKSAGTYNGFIKFGVEGSSIVSEEIPIQVVVESTTVDKPITSLSLECATSVDVNSPLSCICTALPADNTDMSSIAINTTGNVSDKVVTGNNLTFNVTWSTAKTDTVIVFVNGVSSSKTITINDVVTPPVGEDDNTFCFLCFDYSSVGNKVYLEDSLYGGTVNFENGDFFQYSKDSPIYSKSGKIISGWKRSQESTEIYLASIGKIYQKWLAAPNTNGSVENVFSTQYVQYKNVTKYNTEVANCILYSGVPNGSYKLRFLSSTAELNDVYTNGFITINGVDITSQLPTEPYMQKQQWTEYANFEVSNNELIMVFTSKPSKRIGINAFEIKKLS